MVFGLALALGMACAQTRAQDDLEITLQVLDDISAVEGVIMSIDREPAQSTVRAAEGADTPRDDERTRRRSGEAELDAELSREQHNESEIEDLDLPAPADPVPAAGTSPLP
jgi:hypothetical protein